MRVVFGHLWGLWKDLKTSKTLRWRVFRETGTYSSRDKVIFERLLRIFQRWTGSFAKTIFGFACYLLQVFDQAYYITDLLKLIVFRRYIMGTTTLWINSQTDWASLVNRILRSSHSHSHRLRLHSPLSRGRSRMMWSLSLSLCPLSRSRSWWWLMSRIQSRLRTLSRFNRSRSRSRWQVSSSLALLECIWDMEGLGA